MVSHVVNADFSPVLTVCSNSARAGAARLSGVSSCPASDTGTALPNRVRRQLRCARLCYSKISAQILYNIFRASARKNSMDRRFAAPCYFFFNSAQSRTMTEIPFGMTVRLCLLFSQISISADRDFPAFSKAGTFFLLRYLKNGRGMSGLI